MKPRFHYIFKQSSTVRGKRPSIANTYTPSPIFSDILKKFCLENQVSMAERCRAPGREWPLETLTGFTECLMCCDEANRTVGLLLIFILLLVFIFMYDQ